MFLAIIGLSMMFDLSAQKKVLTMEEAVVGIIYIPGPSIFNGKATRIS